MWPMLRMFDSKMLQHPVMRSFFMTAQHTPIRIVMSSHQVFTTIPCFAKTCKDKAIDFM
jgi:hypothetical protein